MDWNRVEGNWKQVKGKIKEKWGNLTDDDLTSINGKRDQLEGKIQERYGLQKDRVRRRGRLVQRPDLVDTRERRASALGAGLACSSDAGAGGLTPPTPGNSGFTRLTRPRFGGVLSSW